MTIFLTVTAKGQVTLRKELLAISAFGRVSASM
jgi:hypothetical protein